MDLNVSEKIAEYDERQRVITELTAFIGDHEMKLDSLLLQLNWTTEKTMDETQPLVQCTIDSSHFVAEESLENHVKQCHLRRDGYTPQEQEEMHSMDWLYSKMKNVVPIKIDEQLQSSVLTQATGVYLQKPVALTAEREVTNLTPYERAIMHDHVVNAAKKLRSSQAISEDLTSDPHLKLKNEKKEPTTYLEMLAAQRDYKRRRQTYKGKSKGVTSNKKSQTEIMKEIIDIHMEELIEQSKNDCDASNDRQTGNGDRNNSSMQSSREGSQCSGRLSKETTPQSTSSQHSTTPPRRHRPRHRSRSPRNRDYHSSRKHKKHKHKERH